MPLERWNDERLDDLAYQVRAFGPVVGQVVVMEAALEERNADIKETRDELRAIHRRLGWFVGIAFAALTSVLGSLVTYIVTAT